MGIIIFNDASFNGEEKYHENTYIDFSMYPYSNINYNISTVFKNVHTHTIARLNAIIWLYH